MAIREASEARRRAVRKHDAEKVDRVTIRLPKGSKTFTSLYNGKKTEGCKTKIAITVYYQEKEYESSWRW